MNRNRSITRKTWAVLLALVVGSLLAQPAQADETPPNAGNGAFEGQATFNAGTWIPPANTPCRAAGFTFSATAVVTLANGTGSENVWVMTPPVGALLTGSGSSTCENSTVGGGLLTIDAIDVSNPVTFSRLRCDPLQGAYTRTVYDFAAVLGGKCAIDNATAGQVSIYLRALFAPASGTGNGVTTNVTATTFAGTFTVVPA